MGELLPVGVVFNTIFFQQQQRFEQKASFLRAGTLLLAAEQGRQGDIGNLHNLEPENKGEDYHTCKIAQNQTVRTKNKTEAAVACIGAEPVLFYQLQFQ